jgi:hypothetical protein
LGGRQEVAQGQRNESKLAMIYVLDATLVDVKRTISDLTQTPGT